MSGRQTKVLNEQAERYGIPLGGRTINLPAVVRALHEFLARNARKLSEDAAAFSDFGGVPSSTGAAASRRERIQSVRERRSFAASVSLIRRNRLLN